MSVSQSANGQRPSRWRVLDPRRWSLGAKIGVTLVVATLAPLAVLARSSLQVSRGAVETAQLDAVEGSAQVASSSVAEYLQGALGRADQLATRPDVVGFLTGGGAPPDLDGELAATDVRALGLFDRLGVPVEVRSPLDSVDFGADRINWFLPASTGRLTTGKVRFNRESQLSTLTLAAPARPPGAAVVGVAAMQISGADILAALHQAPLSAGGQTFIVDDANTVVVARDSRLVGSTMDQLGFSSLLAEIAEQPSGSVPGVVLRDRGAQVVGWSPINDQLTAIVTQPQSVFLGPIDRLASAVWLLFALVGFVAVAGASLLARRLSKPVGVLTAAATTIEAGAEVDTDSLARIGRSHDDVGRLARVFARMAEQVAERERTLRAQVSALRFEIDQQRRAKAVEEVADTDFFRELQGRAAEMRRRAKAADDDGAAGEESP
jgi:hypothetical protein